MSLSSRFSLRSSVLFPRAPLLLLWFLLLLLIVVLLLQLLLTLHVMLVVFVFLFFVIHNADASSTDIDPHASGRSPQTSRICSGAYVATDVSTELEQPELRNIAHVQRDSRLFHAGSAL